MRALVRVLLGVATAAAVAAGCSSAARPDVDDGGIAFQCQRQDCTPDPNGICQHTCTPDPGPRLVDCAGPQMNLDFMMPYIWTFEEPSPVDRARAMYSYTDNTQSIATFYATDGGRQTYQPPTAVLPRCWDPNDHSKSSNPMNRAIHIEGGPFLAWGGGVGIAVKDLLGVTPAVPEDAETNVSQWEGISFWARRGPDSQAGIRVLVGDKNTDDDISYLMYRNDPTVPRYCERVRECACLNHQTCAPVSVQLVGGLPADSQYPNACVPTHLPPHVTPNSVLTLSYCGQPQILSAGSMGAGAGSSTQCNTCIESRCNEPYPAYPDDSATPMGAADPTGVIPQGTDRQFYGKPCSPYTQRPGISSSWCFDPAAGERPAEQTEQCGDHWTGVVNLSNEWQFYTVPFNSMRQQGWAKKSAGLDLTAVSVIRFTWDGGWIDYWIDDVAFYRHKPTP